VLSVTDSRAAPRWAAVVAAGGMPTAIGVPESAATGMSPQIVSERKLTETLVAEVQRLLELSQYCIVDREEAGAVIHICAVPLAMPKILTS
jgi:hypothetical protein